jgi:hypothetical protein
MKVPNAENPSDQPTKRTLCPLFRVERLRLEAVPNAKNLLDAALQGLRQVRCPSARRALRGPSADGFQHCVNMLGIDKAAEAVQAVTEDLRIWCQVTCSPGISG